jgi:hypothetical protein
MGPGVSKKLYAIGDFLVGKEVCNQFACPDDQVSLYAVNALDPSAPAAEIKVPSTTQLVGPLGDKRLAFYEPGQIVVLDRDLSHPKVLALANPAFPAATDVVPGVLHDSTLSYIATDAGMFRKVVIDVTQETATESDLGATPGASMKAQMGADASFFTYWGGTLAVSCSFGVRDARTGVDRFQKSLCVTPDIAPVLLSVGGRTVVVLAEQGKNLIEAFDAVTGDLAWTWGEPLNGLEDQIPFAGITALDDAVMVLPEFSGARILEVNGKLRLDLSNVLHGWKFRVAMAGGVIRGIGNQNLESVQTADASYHAPPNICTLVDCGAGQVNLAIDTQNCGGCGQACPSGQECVAGACR